MDFKVGDVAFYDWIVYAEKVQIVKCFPNSDRYRVRYKKDNEMNAKASEVFITENDLWQSKIDTIDGKIKYLEEKRNEYKSKIVNPHTLNE